jgi:hypothetical protein
MPRRRQALPPLRTLVVTLAMLATLATASAQEPPASRPALSEAAQHAANVRIRTIHLIAPYIQRDPAPASKPQSYRIAIVGRDDVAAIAAEKLAGKKVDEVLVTVVETPVGRAEEGKDSDQYDLLYIAASIDEASRKRIIDSHVGRPVVLVCEAPGFAKAGGGVQLFIKDNNIRFDVNAEAIRRQGLRAAAHLLKLAKKGPE